MTSGNHYNDDDGSIAYRSGKWTAEEEEYAEKLIQLFFSGCEDIGACEGQSLRAFLAMKLRCARMRISKKFTMDGLGKRFKKCTDPIVYESNRMEVMKLPSLELNFRLKDDSVQCNRLKRRKYYDKYKIINDNHPTVSSCDIISTTSINSLSLYQNSNKKRKIDINNNSNSNNILPTNNINNKNKTESETDIYQNETYITNTNSCHIKYDDPLYEIEEADIEFNYTDMASNEELAILHKLFNSENEYLI